MELCLCRTVFAGFHHDWPGFYEASPKVAQFCCFTSSFSSVLPAVCSLLLWENRARCRSTGRWDSALAQRKIQGKWHFSFRGEIIPVSGSKTRRCHLLARPQKIRVENGRRTHDVAFASGRISQTLRIGETPLYCV